ncbi:MAG: STN domain-containing protein [Phycisphaerae bacterium]
MSRAHYTLTGLNLMLVVLVCAVGCTPPGPAPEDLQAVAPEPTTAPTGPSRYAVQTRPATPDEEADEAARLKLLKKVPEIDFNNLEFSNVIQFFRDVSHANFHPNWAALQVANVTKDTPISLQLKDVTVECALRQVLLDLSTTTRLGYVIDGGVVDISTKDDLARHTVNRIYPVKDIIARMMDMAPARTARQRGMDMPNLGPEEQALSDLFEAITSAVDRDSWRPTGTVGAIQEVGGMMVITQTPENQRDIANLLASIRESIEKTRLDLGVAIVRLVKADSRKALREAIAKGGDLAPVLRRGDGRAWQLDRCEVEDVLLGQELACSRSPGQPGGYDLKLKTIDRRDGVIEGRLAYDSAWTEGGARQSARDRTSLRIDPARPEVIELIPAGASGGGVVLILWQAQASRQPRPPRLRTSTSLRWACPRGHGCSTPANSGACYADQGLSRSLSFGVGVGGAAMVLGISGRGGGLR